MDFKVVAGFELKVGTLGSYLPGLENSNKTEQSAQTHHISTDQRPLFVSSIKEEMIKTL